MICIKTDIPEELCRIDDELKAIYHSQDTVCIWVFKTRQDRNRFMDETVGMKKADREKALPYKLFAVTISLRAIPSSCDLDCGKDLSDSSIL